MADEDHLQLLKRGTAIWNEWRAANPEARPELSRADLRGCDLSGANLGGAYMIGADLSRSHMSRAILQHADLRRAVISYARITGADFASANLIHCQLSDSNFTDSVFDGANLSDAQLTDAILRRADLRAARLCNTNLRGATLLRADLTNADLRGANLSGAALGGAILQSATLGGTNFTEAKAGGTFFTDIDLRGVEGLESITHSGPSQISIKTVYNSAGAIPEVFLRGCGVPEDFITYLPSLTVRPIEFYSCFISYSHADKSFARRLHDALQGLGIRCWLDEHQLLPGDDIFEQIDRGIRLWDKVLLCCSKDSLTSWWVDDEIARAFDKEQQLMRQRERKILALIPLNLDDYMFGGEWESGKATQIKSRLAADFTGWESNNSKFEEQFERLVRALRADAGGREVPPVSKL